MNRQDFLESGKLDFTVSKQKMYTEASNLTDYFETPFFATVNNTTGEALGPVRSIEESNTLDEMIRNNITGIANLMKTMQRHEILTSDEIVSDVMDLVANSKNKRKTAIYHERRELLSNSIVGEFREKGNTYYGLFNGITHYLTHSNKSEDSVMDNIAGKASEVSKDAVQLIIKHMKDRGCLN